MMEKVFGQAKANFPKNFSFPEVHVSFPSYQNVTGFEILNPFIETNFIHSANSTVVIFFCYLGMVVWEEM